MQKQAIVAGGCFWGMQELLRHLPGVEKTEVGYTGGHTLDPTYNEVKTASTGHAEAVRVFFDAKQISYEAILKKFFSIHDPTTIHRQGYDRGSQYRSAIFYLDQEQQNTALGLIQKLEQLKIWNTKIVTEVVAASDFYLAEEYHQDYLQKNPGGYSCHYDRGIRL